MIRVVYDEALKEEYEKLFDTCTVNQERMRVVNDIVKRIASNQSRYEAVGIAPWFLIGMLHNLECGLRFDKHLHNGDMLSAKTTHVPNNRPPGIPPWTWEESAQDALRLKHFDTWQDWSIAGILWKLECYNGLGYRQFHPATLTPYLWSMTNHYTKGKYVADGKYNSGAVSEQLGCAALLKRAEQLGVFVRKASGCT